MENGPETRLRSKCLVVWVLSFLCCMTNVGGLGLRLARGAERRRTEQDSASRVTATSSPQVDTSIETCAVGGVSEDTANIRAMPLLDETTNEIAASNMVRERSKATGASDYVIGKEFVPYTPRLQPSKGECLTDPDFRTTFCRISDVIVDNVGDRRASVVYSRWTPLNSNGKYLYLQRAVGSPDALIYSAEDYSLTKILPDRITIDGVPDQDFNSMEGAEIRWDYTGNYADRFYFVQETKFLQYDVPARSSTSNRRVVSC